MADAPDDLPLAAEFPPATEAQWRKLAESVLNGTPFERRLVAKTYDGLAIAPIRPRNTTAQPIAGGPPGSSWTVMQRADHPDAAAANADALQDLENGAAGLTLVFADAIGGYGYGLDGSSETIARLLDGVHLDAGITLDLDLSPRTKDAGQHVANLVKQRGIAPSATKIRFGFDPIGAAAMAGGSPLSWSAIVPIFNAVISDLAARGFGGPFACADGRVIHNTGGSEAQELAYVLATAVTYLRALEAGDTGLDTARGMISFRLSADADQLLTIAKFRALRKLWARVEEACGLPPKPTFVAAETAWRMMTQRDVHVNILRETIAVFSAGLGGADAITTLPFTLALGLPDRFARRIARNTQLLLLEESHLGKVADPAAGSGGIEDLTEQLCHAAWALFQEIEQAGGAWAALEQGVIQKKVAAVRAERESAVARRKDAITGTSDVPDLGESAVSVLGVPRVALPPYPAVFSFDAMRPVRLAQPFEELRDASDRVLALTGARPKVFLANLGQPSDFTARATFARNFFEAGGIEAVGSDGFANRDAVVAAFKASAAKLACLCSSDEIYARDAIDTTRALTALGAHVCLAGRPGEVENALKAAGMRRFIYAGCDALDALRACHHMAGTAT